MSKKLYVCGFLFDPLFRAVVLIRKIRPLWQAGKWNGVGGKIEAGETPLQAMQREFHEEAGLKVESWKPFCVLVGEDYEVHFFMATAPEFNTVKTCTAEVIEIHRVESLGWIITVPNLCWLIPMAMRHWDKNDSTVPFYKIEEAQP